MKIASALLLSLLACVGHRESNAQTYWGDWGVSITVNNVTSSSVTFKLDQSECVVTAPSTVTVPANGPVQFNVQINGHDSACVGGKLSGVLGINLQYVEEGNKKNAFKFEGMNSSDNFCAVKNGAVTYIVLYSPQTSGTFPANYTVCPEVSGQLQRALNQAKGIACPNGVPACPPFVDSNGIYNVGFLYGSK